VARNGSHDSYSKKWPTRKGRLEEFGRAASLGYALTAVIDQRPLVVEHRITTDFLSMVVRYWIEEDPAHGGVALSAAWSQVLAAQDAALVARKQAWAGSALARFLLAQVPAANSVEVCDATGNGVSVHRDWP
jgi:hypothetical protein